MKYFAALCIAFTGCTGIAAGLSPENQARVESLALEVKTIEEKIQIIRGRMESAKEKGETGDTLAILAAELSYLVSLKQKHEDTVKEILAAAKESGSGWDQFGFWLASLLSGILGYPLIGRPVRRKFFPDRTES